MQDDLFEVIPPALDADPWDHPTLKLRTDLPDQLRTGSVPGHDDMSSALVLTRLVRAELEAFGMGGGYKSVVLAIFSRPGFHQRPDEIVATPHEMAASNGECRWPGDQGLGPSLRPRRYALRVRAYRQAAHPHRVGKGQVIALCASGVEPIEAARAGSPTRGSR